MSEDDRNLSSGLQNQEAVAILGGPTEGSSHRSMYRMLVDQLGRARNVPERPSARPTDPPHGRECTGSFQGRLRQAFPSSEPSRLCRATSPMRAGMQTKPPAMPTRRG